MPGRRGGRIHDAHERRRSLGRRSLGRRTLGHRTLDGTGHHRRTAVAATVRVDDGPGRSRALAPGQSGDRLGPSLGTEGVEVGCRRQGLRKTDDLAGIALRAQADEVPVEFAAVRLHRVVDPVDLVLDHLGVADQVAFQAPPTDPDPTFGSPSDALDLRDGSRVDLVRILLGLPLQLGRFGDGPAADLADLDLGLVLDAGEQTITFLRRGDEHRPGEFVQQSDDRLRVVASERGPRFGSIWYVGSEHGTYPETGGDSTSGP